jgi:hypothetical protein
MFGNRKQACRSLQEQAAPCSRGSLLTATGDGCIAMQSRGYNDHQLPCIDGLDPLGSPLMMESPPLSSNGDTPFA